MNFLVTSTGLLTSHQENTVSFLVSWFYLFPHQQLFEELTFFTLGFCLWAVYLWTNLYFYLHTCKSRWLEVIRYFLGLTLCAWACLRYCFFGTIYFISSSSYAFIYLDPTVTSSLAVEFGVAIQHFQMTMSVYSTDYVTCLWYI